MQKNDVQKDLDEGTEGYQHASETETEEIKARWDAEWSSRSDHWAGLKIKKGVEETVIGSATGWQEGLPVCERTVVGLDVVCTDGETVQMSAGTL